MKHSEQSSPIICLSLVFYTHYVSANSIGIGSVLPMAAYICLSIGPERKLDGIKRHSFSYGLHTTAWIAAVLVDTVEPRALGGGR